MLPSSVTSRPGPLATCLIVVAGLLLTLAPPPQAAAQAPASEEVYLRLIGQPVSHTPADPLAIRLRIVNQGATPLQGFLLSLAAHPEASTRSGLHESFVGNAGGVLSARPISFDQTIDPGESFTVELDDPVSSLPTLAAVAEGGVYPFTISLFDTTGAIQHDTLTTSLILYPEPPEVPLNLALVVPLNDVFSRGADGVFGDPLGTGEVPLEAALGNGGWLGGLVRALEAEAGKLPDLERRVKVTRRDKVGRRGQRKKRRQAFKTISVPQRGLHLGLAPTPRLIEELADLAGGYRRELDGDEQQIEEDADVPAAARQVLRQLGRLVGEEGIQPLLVPYSFPDLPALSRHLPERIEPELDQATEVLADELGLELDRDWLFAPAGRIGSQTLEDLRFADPDTARHTFFQADSFQNDEGVPPEGCPQSFASFTCTVSVRTSQGPTDGLVTDTGLQDRFAALVQEGQDALDLQRFFAETAVIRQELPSIEGRVVHATMPSLWHPGPRMSKLLLQGLRAAPWLRTVTPAEALALGEPVSRSDAFIQTLPPLEFEPISVVFEDIEDTAAFIDDFRRLQPPEPLVRRLRRNTLAAQSRLWWPALSLVDVAVSYLDGSREAAEEEISKVTIGGPTQISLTSRSGDIPLVVSNEAGFPASVRISISSPQPDLILEPEVVTPQQVPAADTYQFTVQATARSSGIFPIEVIVETPDGSLEVATKQITIRSTEFNRVALGITLGALAFLVLFYLFRVVRRRTARTNA